jgi:non-homologous end joining protein Ku
VAAEPQPHRAPVIDMMTALKKSLEKTGVLAKKTASRAKPAASHHRRVAHRAAS